MDRSGYPVFSKTVYPELPAYLKFHPDLQKHIFCLYRTNYVPFYCAFANNYYRFNFMCNKYTSRVSCFSCVPSSSSSSPGASISFSGSQNFSKAVAPAAASTNYIKSYLLRCSTTAFADPSTLSRSSTFLYQQHLHAFLMISSVIFPILSQSKLHIADVMVQLTVLLRSLKLSACTYHKIAHNLPSNISQGKYQ